METVDYKQVWILNKNFAIFRETRHDIKSKAYSMKQDGPPIRVGSNSRVFEKPK